MSILQDAHVSFLLADYAGNDAAGKLNVIGGGIAFLGTQPDGASTPFTLIARVEVPSKYVNQSYALSIELHDVTIGQVVRLPGEGGQLQPLRAQQVVNVTPIMVPQGAAVPDDALVATTMIMNFVQGLPLPQGHSFEWKLQIDGQHRQGWWHRFHVLGPAPGPVFGGPTGPAAIPGVGEYIVDSQTDEPPGEPQEPPRD